ncbi:MAG: putative bicarbonate transporter, IctB family [Synechococcales cyanobacterium T60_A2020_003]|nr:putative bicarbonate transporter, IctB family [Synechococcales cyanobacterium T60_A2020_003]
MVSTGWRSLWQTISLANLSPYEWGRSSYTHRLAGLVHSWRGGSRLLQWADFIGLILILLVFVLAPYISTTLIGVLLLSCAAFWALLTLSDDARPHLTPIHLPVLLYWFISVFATALSPVKAQAIEGLIKLTLYMLLFALLARLLRSPLVRSSVITGYLLTALLVSVMGIRQWFFGVDALATWVDPDSAIAGTTRVYSYLGNPNLLAAYLLPASMFSAAAVFAWKRWIPKALAALMFVINSACLVVTFSRGGWIGFVFAGFVLLLLLVNHWSVRLPRFWQKWAVPFVLAASAGFVLFAVMSVEPLRDRAASIFAGREDSSNNFRINVWMAVIEMVKDRPFLGIGPGNAAFNKVYPFYQQPGYTALSAYSILLEIAVETGFIGLSCFLWLLTVTFNQGRIWLTQMRQDWNREVFWLMAAIATMVGMLMHGMVDTVWYRPQVSTLWWLMLAIVSSYYQFQPVRERHDAEG